MSELPQPNRPVTNHPIDRAAVDSMSPDELAKFLSGRLQNRAPLPRPRMAPQLSYGRHRGPSPSQSRLAAVAVALYVDPDQGWTLPLTLRPTTLQHHAGQVCLPGGRVESDETVVQAAIREFEEELGIRPAVQHLCGELSTQYVYASGNLVHPVVMIVDSPAKPWSPDPREVLEVISLPLRVIDNPANRKPTVRWREVRVASKKVDRMSFHAESIEHQGHLIWGATALILDQLAQILQPD